MKQLLKGPGETHAKGPLPYFTPAHLIYAILAIGDSGPIGRKRLSAKLGVGEGTIRTILNRLKGLDAVRESRAGYTLTQKGKRFYGEIKSRITVPVEVSFPLPIEGKYKAAVVIRGAAELVKTGVEERDEAVRAGAKAALVLVREGDEIHMPRLSNLSREQPELAKAVVESLKPENGDVIIITTADNDGIAKYSSLAVALYLVKKREGL